MSNGEIEAEKKKAMRISPEIYRPISDFNMYGFYNCPYGFLNREYTYTSSNQTSL